MQLDRVIYHNFRCFEEATLDLHPQLTVVVGANGAGKTALMEGIAIAMGTYLGAFDEARGDQFKATDARRLQPQEASADNEPQYPVEIEAVGKIVPTDAVRSWRRSLKGKKSRSTVGEARYLSDTGNELQRRVRRGEAISLPLLAFYGTGRLWGTRRLTENKKQILGESRIFGYHQSMNPTSGYKEFAYWYKQLFLAQAQQVMQKMRRREDEVSSSYDSMIHVVQETVDALLKPTGCYDLFYDAGQDEIAAVHPEAGSLPVASLSDGVRDILGLTADIAFRCCKLNPQLKEKAVQETRGLIMIDGVDMYLHTTWQQTIVGSLQKTFPRIQFVLGTQSPQLLTTVRKENIRIICVEKDGRFVKKPDFSPLGHESGDALARLMDTHKRPELEIQGQVRLYEEYVRDGEENTSDARQLFAQLESSGYEFHESDLKTWRFLAGRKQKAE